MSYDNPWLFRGEPVQSEDIQDYVGFVYCITDLDTGKRYFGKKFLKHKKKIHRKTGRKVRNTIVESDWKKYYGSNDTLKEEVAKRGGHRFRREILHLCRLKKQLSYFETKEQFLHGVLETDGFYNSNIAGKFFRVDPTDVLSAGKWDLAYQANTSPWRTDNGPVVSQPDLHD